MRLFCRARKHLALIINETIIVHWHFRFLLLLFDFERLNCIWKSWPSICILNSTTLMLYRFNSRSTWTRVQYCYFSEWQNVSRLIISKISFHLKNMLADVLVIARTEFKNSCHSSRNCFPLQIHLVVWWISQGKRISSNLVVNLFRVAWGVIVIIVNRPAEFV